MLTQLPTPIPLNTPKGKAWAVAIIDYGPAWDLLWVTFVHSSGECWTFNNKDIRQERNDTFGIMPPAFQKPAQANGHNLALHADEKENNFHALLHSENGNKPN